MVGSYWKGVAKRAWRRSIELVRLESGERVIVFLIGLVVPAIVVWFWLGDSVGASVRALAAIGGSGLAALAIFAWSLVRLPSVMAAEQASEIERLEAQQESAESLKAKRVALGQLLSQAEAIKRDCTQSEPVSEHMVTEWYERACKFLTDEMGEEYLHRFQSDAGTPPMEISGPIQRNRDLWAWANRRAYRLNTILEAMPTRP